MTQWLQNSACDQEGKHITESQQSVIITIKSPSREGIKKNKIQMLVRMCSDWNSKNNVQGKTL